MLTRHPSTLAFWVSCFGDTCATEEEDGNEIDLGRLVKDKVGLITLCLILMLREKRNLTSH